MRKFFMAIAIGILVGVATHIAERFLPSNYQFIVATKIVWLLPAFLISFRLPYRYKLKESIIISIFFLLVCCFTYLLSEVVKNNGAFTFPEKFAHFLIIGLIAGAVTGAAAYYAKAGTKWIKYTGSSLVPAIFTGDGLDKVITSLNHFQLTPEILVKIAGGVILYIAVSKHNKFKIRSILTFTILAVIATLVYLYVI